MWVLNVDYNRKELESFREEYISIAFDHFIEFALKNQLNKII